MMYVFNDIIAEITVSVDGITVVYSRKLDKTLAIIRYSTEETMLKALIEMGFKKIEKTS